MSKHEFHIYASTKTTAQLFLDLASAVSHCFTLYVLMTMVQRDTLWQVLFYIVCATIGIQAVLGIGLFILRVMVLNHGRGEIPRAAKYLNNVAFWACLFVAILEVAIAGIEKLALDGKHGSTAGFGKDCPALVLNTISQVEES